MTDIVQKLRLVDPNQVLLMEPPYDTRYLHAGLLCHEAANEIERLREALRSIAGNGCCDRCQEAALVARSALKKGEQLPTPPEECQTEAEKKAFAFGYWSGVAAIRARGEKP